MKTKNEDKEIAVIEKQVSPIVARAEELKVKDQKSMEQATKMLSELNIQKDKITAEKEKVTKPLNEALKAERARWKPIETILDTAIGFLRNSISDWQTAETKRVREEEAKIAARTGEGKGKIKVETAVAKINEIERPNEKVVSDAGMVQFREDKILKIMDETMIPREYLIPDEAKILADLKAGKKVKGCELDIKMTPINYR